MTCEHNNWRIDTNGGRTCRDCQNIYMKQYQKDNNEVYVARQKAYREKNLEKLKTYDRERNQSPERKLAMKEAGLKKRWKLTLEQYYKMWADQDNKCAICSKELTDGKLGAHVDHDHKCCDSKSSCGKCIRGILCMDCNNLIERAKEDELILIAAGDYLRKWNPTHA